MIKTEKVPSAEIKEIFYKYKKRLQKELLPEEAEERGELSYSRAYEIFKSQQVSKQHNFYEKLCNGAGRILKLKLKPVDVEKVEPALRMAHIDTTPEAVYALATLLTIIVILISAAASFLSGNLLIALLGMAGALGFFLYIPAVPKRIFLAWRAKASDQIILAVLYMIIYMEHTPNLELATWFAARHLPAPLSLDFMKVLWDVETKKYSTIQASLEDYVEGWRGWDDEFIESMHLIESSLVEPSPEEQLDTLAKAEEVILEGTQDHMLAFSHSLQAPIETLHMMGIVLPVMGLVMLPMVSAFMGASIKWYYLVLLYNVLLPLVIYGLAKSILSVRPAGANPSDVYVALEEKYNRPAIDIFGFKLHFPPRILALIMFGLISVPSIIYFSWAATLAPEVQRPEFLLSAGNYIQRGFSCSTWA